MTWFLAIGRLALGSVFARGIAGTSPPASAAPFSGLNVFGDSLTDTGDAQLGALALGQQSPTPAALDYFDGRFSNRPVWVDNLNH
jgi:phospholipase/lecithinase/hemolysin